MKNRRDLFENIPSHENKDENENLFGLLDLILRQTKPKVQQRIKLFSQIGTYYVVTSYVLKTFRTTFSIYKKRNAH